MGCDTTCITTSIVWVLLIVLTMFCEDAGGQGGIRTHGRLPPTAVFKTAALNHSATCPQPEVRLSERSCSVSRAGRKGIFARDFGEVRKRVNGMFNLLTNSGL